MAAASIAGLNRLRLDGGPGVSDPCSGAKAANILAPLHDALSIWKTSGHHLQPFALQWEMRLIVCTLSRIR